MSKKILIVEDEKNIVDILSFNLGREGYETLAAYDGAQGLELALAENPDLILLDVMLPKMNGFDVCRSVREKNNSTPIIMLTAREGESDKVLGLELGADDYITKPFSMRELLARVKTNIRRTDLLSAHPTPPADSGESRLARGRILIDANLLMAYKDGQALDLTPKEFELLRFLAAAPEQVVSRETLLERVWNYEGFVGDVRAVDVAIRRLREKIEDDPANPAFIVTRRGLGYLFRVG